MSKTTGPALATLLGLAACMPQAGTTGPGAQTPTSGMGSGVTVGGHPMLATKTILDNAATSTVHTVLVSAVTTAGLADMFRSPGPFTLFAPTNAAFAQLPPGTLDRLVRPENKAILVRLLAYHVVPGRLDAAALKRAIEAGGGSAGLRTASGGTLTAVLNGPGNIVIRDAQGVAANISTYDAPQSNGVIHVIDRVLTPK